VLDVFRKEIEHTRKLILAADTKLTDTEKLEKGKQYKFAKCPQLQKRLSIDYDWICSD